jgi:hypothetical protein
VRGNQGTDLIGPGAPGLDAHDEVAGDRGCEGEPEAPGAQLVNGGVCVGCVGEDRPDATRRIMGSFATMIGIAVDLDPGHVVGAFVQVIVGRIELRPSAYPSGWPRRRASRIVRPGESATPLASSQPW